MPWREEVAVVTGASSGIGRAAALAFAAEGARVVVSDICSKVGEDTVREIASSRGDAIFVKADVSRSEDVAALIERTVQNYGQLDFAFNNAGIEGDMAVTAECTEENWDRTLAVNLKGVWLCMKHELGHMLARRRGAIVNCSSVAGLVGFQGQPAYVASEHGIVGVTRCAALEYAKYGIRVNAVCPGVIATPMVERIVKENPDVKDQLTAGEPVGRMGKPEEVAAAVVWLCSARASFVTGQAIAVDGGWIAQ
jgi:NAD(P)-dependent dehydrogenase (short-subunit alcohol dehydrogenase family)